MSWDQRLRMRVKHFFISEPETTTTTTPAATCEGGSAGGTDVEAHQQQQQFQQQQPIQYRLEATRRRKPKQSCLWWLLSCGGLLWWFGWCCCCCWRQRQRQRQQRRNQTTSNDELSAARINPNQKLALYLHWMFRVNFVFLFVVMCTMFFALVITFAALITIAGQMDSECVRIGGNEFDAAGTAFADAFALSWTSK